MSEKTHYRKAFDSPYLSSADIVEPIVLTIREVRLEPDKSKKTKDKFNTAHFFESEIRPGEKLKPMILNATNSKMMRKITGTPFIDDWRDVRVKVFVDQRVRFGSETVEGLRIAEAPIKARPAVTPNSKSWERAKEAYKRDGNLDAVLAHADMSEAHQAQLIAECAEAPNDIS